MKIKRRFYYLLFLVSLISLLTLLWPYFHNNLFQNYILHRIEKNGGMDIVNCEADSLISLIDKGASWSAALSLKWRALRGIGLISIKPKILKKQTGPTYVGVWRGNHYKKYCIRIYRMKDSLLIQDVDCIKITPNIIATGKNVWSIVW